MKFANQGAEIFVPDGLPVPEALARTTELAVGAHPDDIEIMALHGIMRCFGEAERWFAGVVVTDGSGFPRGELAARYTLEEIRQLRRKEQRKAAVVGEYGALIQLDYPSAAVKDPSNRSVIDDLKRVLHACRPEVVYTHNLADSHETHVAVALKVIAAIRELPAELRPPALRGGEVWRSLDWMSDDGTKLALDVSAHAPLGAALLGDYDSQLSAGKSYDLAASGRRRANATFHDAHEVDHSRALDYAMDLTPLLRDDSLDPEQYVSALIDRFASDVRSLLRRLR